MRISTQKSRTPLGKVLFTIPEWHRKKIKGRLVKLGVTEGGYRTIHERTPAHLLPSFIQDVIVDELPNTAEVFTHPNL